MKNHISGTPPPELIESWLTSKGSLTKRLENKAGQPLKVEVIFEGYKQLSFEQKKQLNLTTANLTRPIMGWFRECFLYGNFDTPWIFAQSIFPVHSLKGEAKRLKSLKNTPIGYVLFKKPQRVKTTRTIQKVNAQWRRNNLYNWQGRDILISESFLASFFNDSL